MPYWRGFRPRDPQRAGPLLMLPDLTAPARVLVVEASAPGVLHMRIVETGMETATFCLTTESLRGLLAILEGT